MKVVILCGGLGTRLREETEFRPKPLVEIGDRPILWHIMKTFSHWGLREFVLCLGYKGDLIRRYFLDYQNMTSDLTLHLGAEPAVQYHSANAEQDWRVTLAETGSLTMTGGRVKRIQRYVAGETFMVTYGDGLADIDIRDLLKFHRQHGRVATVTAVHPVSKYGILDADHSGVVKSFREKPLVDGWISAGFFVFEPGVFDYLTGDDCVLEQEPLQRLAADDQLIAYRHTGFWQPMDTFRESRYLNDLWAAGKAPWRIWDKQV